MEVMTKADALTALCEATGNPRAKEIISLSALDAETKDKSKKAQMRNMVHAFERASIFVTGVTKSIDKIEDWELPCLVIADNGWLLIHECFREGDKPYAWKVQGKSFETTELPHADLISLLSGRRKIYGVRVLASKRQSSSTKLERDIRVLLPLQRWGSAYSGIAISTLLAGLLTLVIPLIAIQLLDFAVPANAFNIVLVTGGIAALVLLFDFVFKMIRMHLAEMVAEKTDVVMNSRILSGLITQVRDGSVLSVGAEYAYFRAWHHIKEVISTIVTMAFFDLPFALVFIILVASYAHLAVWPVLLITMALLVFFVATARLEYKIAHENNQLHDEKAEKIMETLGLIDGFKRTGTEAMAQTRLNTITARSAKKHNNVHTMRGLTRILAQTAITATIIGTIIYGSYLAMVGDISVGMIFAASLLGVRAIEILTQILMVVPDTAKAWSSLALVTEVLSMPSELGQKRTAKMSVSKRPSIVIDNLQAGYPGQENILDGLSVRIRPGFWVVTGSSGVGKTTLEKVLTRVLPMRYGSIKIDETDMEDIPALEWRRLVYSVSQDPVIWSGSLRENLDPQGLWNDQQLEKALYAACAEDLTKGVGLDLYLLAGGENLAHGQRRKINLARGLLSTAPVLILDDPTAGWDSVTKQNFLERCKMLFEAKTVIVLSHDIKMIEASDYIAIMEDGKIKEARKTTDLIQRGIGGRSS